MAFLDGELNSVRRGAVEEHLKTCPQCCSLLESLELAERQVVQAEKVEAPEGYFTTFASRVANRIAGEELASRRRPWLLRWGWMPAAAATAFAAVMVLSHGFYDKPMVRQAALERKVIPIPIAPEPRMPKTEAVLETYYVEMPAEPAEEGLRSEKDRLAASGPVQPAPAAAPPAATPEVAGAPADEIPTPARTRAASSPGLVDMSGAPSAPPTLEAKSKTAGAAKRSAPEASPETVEKTQAPSAPALEAKELGSSKRDDRDKAEPGRPPQTMETRTRLVRIRQTGASRVLLPAEPDEDICRTPDIAAVEAIVIHLPNGGQSRPPEVEPALRIRLPQ